MAEASFEHTPEERRGRPAERRNGRPGGEGSTSENGDREASERAARGLQPAPEFWITSNSREGGGRRTGKSLTGAPSSQPIVQQGSGLLFALNFSVAALGLLLLSPLMLLIALAIKLDSPGPVIYRQLRVGRDRRSPRSDSEGGRRSDDIGGRPFFIYKFRTMHVDAEEETGPVWASEDDDRCTRVGRVLRRYRLDELPQLINVLRGEMSVVGPRPERPAYVRRLSREIESYPVRQRVRPGITGWAQINQGSDTSMDDVRRKIEYDKDYVQQRSVWLDMQIMLRTPRVMARAAQSSEEERTVQMASEEGWETG